LAIPIDEQPALDAKQMVERIESALDSHTKFDSDCPAHLRDAIRYALLAPGKRLRPRLVLMAAEACGASFEAALPAACAVEMVHAYSLVHDDLPAMDDDDLRRGRPTCHKVYGEDVAILVGDALLALAFEVLATRIESAATAAKCCAVLGRAAGASALVGGQAADLHMTDVNGEAPRDLAELEAIHRRKTGALIRASLELGAIVAGASDNQISALRSYGDKLGLAFQITDDLLDVSGNPSDVGKRLAKDAERGKLTFPSLLGCGASREQVAKLIGEACAMIEVFGAKAEPLQALAKFVGEREN
jgi:geranylgeranyl diphosphate synthase, type II